MKKFLRAIGKSFFQFLKHLAQAHRLWRNLLSVLFAVSGFGVVGWAGVQLVQTTQVPECTYSVDERSSNIKDQTNIIKLQIAGAVKKPGIYEMIYQDRIIDLIEAAGGLSPDADEETVIRQFNLAAKLQDEQRIFIPFKQEQELDNWLQAYCDSVAAVNQQDTTIYSSEKDQDLKPSTNKPQPNKTPTPTSSSFNNYLDPTPIASPSTTIDNDTTNNDCISLNNASSDELETLSGVGPATANLIIDGRPYLNVTDLLNVKGIGQATLEKLEPYICL